MSKTPPILANLPPEVQAYVAAQAAELSVLKQEFLGVSLDHAAAQKRLKAEMASVDAALSAERTAHARAIQNRDTITPSDACTDCGGSFKVLGTDVMEELEYVPGHYIVNQIGRPRLACTCCEAVVQAEMPSRPIPKSFVGPELMAQILCCKYGYHLPLYSQSQMFANEGIDLSGSLMAGWIGKCSKLLERVSDAIRDHVFEAQAIFMDDTTVKLLQKGNGKGKNKTKTARL
jgi:transposase